MGKPTVLPIVVGLMLVLVPTAGASPGLVMLDKADLSTMDGAVVVEPPADPSQAWSFNPEQPGNWGDEYGYGVVTAFPLQGTSSSPAETR